MYQVAMLLCFVLLLSGCVSKSHHEEVIGVDVPRKQVVFESEEARSRFVQEVANRYPAERRQSYALDAKYPNGSAVPHAIAASTTKVLSENAFYNSQVAKADANGDQTLTDGEVDIYVTVR